MKRIFVDTNIIIDLLGDRVPYSKFAISLFALAENKEVKLYSSSHSLVTTHYLLKKYMEEKELRKALMNLLDFITIIPVDIQLLKRGLQSKYKDFEDSIQILAAVSIDNMDFIVTRNLKDFKGSPIPVYSPEVVLNKI